MVREQTGPRTRPLFAVEKCNAAMIGRGLGIVSLLEIVGDLILIVGGIVLMSWWG